MSSSKSSMNGDENADAKGQSSDFASRHNSVGSSSKNTKTGDKPNDSEDQETMEFYSRARAQEKEILHLRQQIALASINESQLLNEKYTLERKFSELRMALDEKQNEAITSASKELALRKGDLEVNLNLLNELKVAEDEKHIFMSSMLGILAEYGFLPHVTNASALTNSIKHLHDQLQSRITTSNARLAELNSIIIRDARIGPPNKEIHNFHSMNGQLPSSSMGVHGYSPYNNYSGGKHFEDSNMPRYLQDSIPAELRSSMHNSEVHHLLNNEDLRKTMPDTNRDFAGNTVDNLYQRNELQMESDRMVKQQYAYPSTTDDRIGSFGSEEEGPGIEGFQVIGDAKPGCKLLGCGYPVRGTSLCMFQWVRHYQDGTRQYIEGATNPDYVVTADDVDKLIAVECIPMDEQGRQGDLVRVFANDHNKITCDEEMQDEIDNYISTGQATFGVQTLFDSSENWEPTTLFLRRSGFQVKVERTQAVEISEKYSKDVLIKIPSGLSAQFVLTCPNGSSYPFSTNNDIRMRDTIVLTMRIFQNKALDEKRKGKA